MGQVESFVKAEETASPTSIRHKVVDDQSCVCMPMMEPEVERSPRSEEYLDDDETMAEELAECEHSFLNDFVLLLERGINVKKHGKKVRERTVKISEAHDEINWNSLKHFFDEKIDDSVKVADILDVRRGSFVGKDVPANVQKDHCLSLLTKTRTLNLELQDQDIRDLCADGIALLYQRITLHPLPSGALD